VQKSFSATLIKKLICHSKLNLMAKVTRSMTVADERIVAKIFFIRGQKVMLDHDLAELYQVPTGRLNEQVKRNRADEKD
jgi:uncharacterized protein YllA (UPF0747 family)